MRGRQLSIIYLFMHSFFFLNRRPYISNANIVDPDQTLRSAASSLGLLCLPLSVV